MTAEEMSQPTASSKRPAAEDPDAESSNKKPCPADAAEKSADAVSDSDVDASENIEDLEPGKLCPGCERHSVKEGLTAPLKLDANPPVDTAVCKGCHDRHRPCAVCEMSICGKYDPVACRFKHCRGDDGGEQTRAFAVCLDCCGTEFTNFAPVECGHRECSEPRVCRVGGKLAPMCCGCMNICMGCDLPPPDGVGVDAYVPWAGVGVPLYLCDDCKGVADTATAEADSAKYGIYMEAYDADILSCKDCKAYYPNRDKRSHCRSARDERLCLACDPATRGDEKWHKLTIQAGVNAALATERRHDRQRLLEK
jgi:hypothetical protein